jgi:monofunctional biosynthetic peptidoglycan transglycosylase
MTERGRLAIASSYAALVALGAGIIALLATLPDVSALEKNWPQSTSLMRIRAAEARKAGRELRIVYAPVPLSQIPRSVQRAIRVAEDAAFFQHRGFDWFELREAVSEAWEEKAPPRGASTITQQLARNLYLSPRRSLVRKLREALITERLEAELSKDRIFELYLNVIEFGAGVFGVEAAARHYFGIPVGQTDRLQAAQLAATIPAPLRQNPSTDTRGFRWRTELAYRRAFAPEDSTGEDSTAMGENPRGEPVDSAAKPAGRIE